MILPFSSSRSSTSLISNCLYWASLTPRAMFSKSMNSASLRSPFILFLVLTWETPSSPRPPTHGAPRKARGALLPLGCSHRGAARRFSLRPPNSPDIIFRKMSASRSYCRSCHGGVQAALYSERAMARLLFELWRSRRMKAVDPALAHRVPPGQTLTSKWPVLTYGLTPRFDPRRWTFRCFGLVEREVTWTWEEFLALPRVTLTSDVHCVTRWSKLDNVWEVVHVREVMGRRRPLPEARFVVEDA